MVDHHKVCKISDFGLSRNLNDTGSEMYEQKTKVGIELVHIKWAGNIIDVPCLGRSANPLDGPRISLLQCIYSKVRCLELRDSDVGNCHSRYVVTFSFHILFLTYVLSNLIRLDAISWHGRPRGDATCERWIQVGKAKSLPSRILQDHLKMLVRRHEQKARLCRAQTGNYINLELNPSP